MPMLSAISLALTVLVPLHLLGGVPADGTGHHVLHFSSACQVLEGPARPLGLLGARFLA
jgi:hypothetical protein